MCKHFFGLIFVFLFIPSFAFATTAADIKETFSNDHEAFLRAHYVLPLEKKEAVSILSASYQRKRVEDWLNEDIKDYLNDEPLTWVHILSYQTYVVQSYDRARPETLLAYDVSEKDGNLKVVHRASGYAFGQFKNSGGFVMAEDDYDRIDLGFWYEVIYDPWDNLLYHRVYIGSKMLDSYINVDAEDLYFRFKDDAEDHTRVGTFQVKTFPGFKVPVVFFEYGSKTLAVSTEVESKRNIQVGGRIGFEVTFQFKRDLVSVDARGVVLLNMTAEEFATL